MKMTLKNMPKLHLSELLRRRKMSLRQLMDEFGMTTHESLVIHCRRMGIVPPDEATFRQQFPQQHVNNPQEGVVVIESVVDQPATRPMPTFLSIEPEPIDELTTQDEPLDEGALVVEGASQLVPELTQKKQRKKKDGQSGS